MTRKEVFMCIVVVAALACILSGCAARAEYVSTTPQTNLSEGAQGFFFGLSNGHCVVMVGVLGLQGRYVAPLPDDACENGAIAVAAKAAQARAQQQAAPDRGK